MLRNTPNTYLTLSAVEGFNQAHRTSTAVIERELERAETDPSHLDHLVEYIWGDDDRLRCEITPRGLLIALVQAIAITALAWGGVVVAVAVFSPAA